MITSPFHTGERAIRSRLGVRDEIESFGARAIRDHMPDQHRALYGQLPLLLIGALDDAGSIGASPVFGKPGFISTPDARTLSVGARPLPGDPLAESLVDGRAVGVLGIELHSRRRNRLVRVESNVALVFPDFPGNRFFNTFGNIQCDPRAGLLFPDFGSGDLLYLTGTAEILWEDPGLELLPAAERFVRFSLSHGWFLSRAMPLRWSHANPSQPARTP